jgi:hypothetical protein
LEYIPFLLDFWVRLGLPQNRFEKKGVKVKVDITPEFLERMERRLREEGYLPKERGR